MNPQQEHALDSLKELRDWLRYQAYAMASLEDGEADDNQRLLLYELHENYDYKDDEGWTARALCVEAFGGTPPFYRVNWERFEDWNEMTETEQADFIIDQNLDEGMDDFNCEDVGHIKWLVYCYDRAKDLINVTIWMIESYLYAYGKDREPETP